MADEVPATSAAAPATSDVVAAPSAPTLETAAVEPKIERAEVEAAAPKPLEVTAESEAPQVAAAPVQKVADAPAAEIKATAAELATSPRAKIAAGAAAVSSVIKTSARHRYASLAATIVLAAGLGVVAGALGAQGFTQVGARVAIAAPASEKTVALQNTIARMQTELAALRTSIEAVTRATNGQFAKITERFDRIEKAQSERAAKFTKAVDTLDRLEKRADVAPVREATSSMPAPQPVAAAPAQAPQPPQQSQQPQQPILEGWVVRNVYRGTAIVQNRRIGTIDVEPGDVLPGIGRIESIKKQDGRWVVVTSRGLITSMR
jgi:hypothetical protein